MAVALDKEVASQPAALEVVEELALQVQGGILVGKGRGIQHSSVLRPTESVNTCLMTSKQIESEGRQRDIHTSYALSVN